MIVYGDRPRRVASRAYLDLIARVDRVNHGAGRERHERLVSLLITCGELAQGIADQRWDATGTDGLDPAAQSAMALTVAVAHEVWRSHKSGYVATSVVDSDHPIVKQLRRLAGQDLPPLLTVHPPEGFLHYALYPETYAAAAAARRFALGDQPPLTIGIRSIGATLAAMVAAGCQSDAVPVTVRPTGDPYARHLNLAPEFRSWARDRRGRDFAVVDEGPGRSGSSFAAVIEALESTGVAARNIHAFPSHLGLGPCASARIRQRWEATSRHHVSFESLFLGRVSPDLRTWTEDLTGPLTAPPVDLGAGQWRAHLFTDPGRWPAVDVQRERRKYLLRAGPRAFFVKFAGLGRYGAERLARAVRLAQGGFSPAVCGLAHGFLVQPWLSNALPLCEARAQIDRARFLDRLAAYLRFRAEALPAPADVDLGGADPTALFQMALANAAEGSIDCLHRLRQFEPWLPELTRTARPMAIDGRLHLWEWLVLPGGTVVKADAVDHCDGHDLIGCQDIAWDLAGAAVELSLSDEELDRLRRQVARDGAPAAPEAVAFYRMCYLAFQMGAHRLAFQSAVGGDPSEAARLEQASARYAGLLSQAGSGG
jgi:hypothetical protein